VTSIHIAAASLIIAVKRESLTQSSLSPSGIGSIPVQKFLGLDLDLTG